MSKISKLNSYSKRRKILLIIVASIVCWAVTIFSVFYVLPHVALDAEIYLRRVADKKSYELSKPASVAFQQESKALDTTISAIVGDNSPEQWDQCDTYETTTTHTWAECSYSLDYKYNAKPSSKTISSLTANTKKLNQLLVNRGWAPWRPNDPNQIVTANNPLDPTNLGSYASIAYYKNIGNVTCDLEIDFDELDGSAQTGSILVNTFNCSQKVDYPHNNPKNWKRTGGP